MITISKWIKRLSAAFFLVISIVILPLIFPKPLFAYTLTSDDLIIHSDAPLQSEKAQAFFDRIKNKLDQSPIHNDLQTMQIYIVNTKWRRNWLWLVHLGKSTGGFVVPPLTKNYAFLSGADFKTNELIAPSGYRPQSPRTLDYYGVHELTHIVTSKKVGALYFSLLMPTWIREGFADYVAMPVETAFELFSKIGKNDADLTMMKAHGAYPPYRLLVTYFMDEEGWTVDELLSSRLTLIEARNIAFEALDGSI